MRDKPEYTLLQVLADMAVNHGGAEFAGFTRKKKNSRTFFFFLKLAMPWFTGHAVSKKTMSFFSMFSLRKTLLKYLMKKAY